MADRSATTPGWIAKIIRDASPGNELEMMISGGAVRRVVEASETWDVPAGWISVCWCETGTATASSLEIEDYSGATRDVSFVVWFEDANANTIKTIHLVE